MNKLFAVLAPLFVASTVMAAPEAEGAQKPPPLRGQWSLVGCWSCRLGAGLGIGRIGGTACEATARQPEVKGQIFTNMLLTAALIEGVHSQRSFSLAVDQT